MKITKQRRWVDLTIKRRQWQLTFTVHADEGTFGIAAESLLTRSAFLKRFVQATGRIPYSVPTAKSSFERWMQILLEEAEQLPDDPGQFGVPKERAA